MSELVVRNEAAVVKAIPVPRELQEVGVRIGSDESGMRVVYLPPELRQRVNIVNPTTSYVQADPNWTPGISLVTIDVDRDTYNVAGKRGLSKQALETLSKAAGVLYTRTARVPAAELQPGERYAYRATVGFRRSDGTIDELTRERGWNEDVEREKIVQAVDTGEKTKGLSADAKAGEVRKRWLAELEFGPAKTESKAINRALRAGLSIPTSLSPADAKKPFLVIGYNFTPDYNDPEIKRQLVAIGLNAQAAIYGGREVSGELGPGSDVEGVVTPRDGAEDVDEPQAAQAPGGSVPGVDAEQTGGGAEAKPQGPAAAPAPTTPEPALDTEPPLEPSVIRVPEAAIEQAAQTPIASKDGRTIAELMEIEAFPTWALWALTALPDGGERAALALVVEHRLPELWAAHAPAETA